MAIDNKYDLIKHDTQQFFKRLNKTDNLEAITRDYEKLISKFISGGVPLFFFAACVDGFITDGTITENDKHKLLFALMENDYEDAANSLKIQLSDIEIVKSTYTEDGV